MFYSADETHRDEVTSAPITGQDPEDTTEPCTMCGAQAGEPCRSTGCDYDL